MLKMYVVLKDKVHVQWYLILGKRVDNGLSKNAGN